MTTRTRILMVAILLVIGGSLASLCEGVFSGLWSADMVLSSVQTNPVTAFGSRLDTALTLSPLRITSRSDFSSDRWLWQSFGMLADVGFLSMGTEVLFVPDPWAFAYASAFVRLDFGLLWTAYHVGFIGSVFDGDLHHGSVVEIGAAYGVISLRSLTYFGATLDGILFNETPSYTPCIAGDCIAPSSSERYFAVFPSSTGVGIFTGEELTITGHLGDDILVTSSTVLSPAGFESQEFHAEVWSLAGLPIVFNVTLRYEIQTKSLSIEPSLGLGTRNCHGQILVELITHDNGILITGFSVYGLDLHIETPSFGFRSLSLFDRDRFSIYQGNQYRLDDIWIDNAGSSGSCGSAGMELVDYWQVLGFGVYRGDPCCQQLRFVALSYFGDVSSPFDWMQTQFKAEFTPMAGFAVRTSLSLSKDGISSWKLGVSIAW